MLATKLLPEMEAEERALLAALHPQKQQQGHGSGGASDGASGASGTGGAGAPLESLPPAEQFAWVADQERELNHLIDALAGDEGGVLGSKGERRRELQAAVGKAVAAAAAAAVPPAAAPPAAVGSPGQPRKLPPPDPLLAAVTFGAGL